jgi:hypothetical protein
MNTNDNTNSNTNNDTNNNTNNMIEKYFKSLSEKEKKAYEIAKSHLGMSFQIEKSNGFIKFRERMNSIKEKSEKT